MMTDECLANRANAAGLRASRAWLLGTSLANEIEEVRFQAGEDPIPAPGLPMLLERLEQDLYDVLALSERVDALLLGPERTVDLPSIVEVEVDAAEEGADETERVARRLAQLALGVSTGLVPSKRAERLDSAAVAVLHPPSGTGIPVGLAEDGLELFCHSRRELLVELRGTFCRMLLDRNVAVDIGDVGLRVEFDQVLHLTTPDGATAWEAPVEVTVPARETSRALKSLGMSCRKIRRRAVVR
jgi:hypothetical protein